MVSVALSRSRTSLISLLLAASARVNEVGKCCQGDLQPPRKIGLLAGIFEDGTMSVYVVPYPARCCVDRTLVDIYAHLW